MKIANFLFAFLLLLQSTVIAQKIGEPYPAPVSYAALSETEKAFFGLFEDKNVGNLHVFTPAGLPAANDYFFKGKAITSDYNNLLPPRLRPYTNVKGYQPLAVFTIKGAGREFFIIRTNSPKNNKLGLYAKYGENLSLVAELASFKKTNKSFVQLDSWVKDLNGDGRLDLIQKTRTQQGNKTRTKTKVWLQNARGQFKRTRNIKINPIEYRMQVI